MNAFQEKNPKNAEAYERRGLCYQQRRKPEKAIPDFEEALKILPKAGHQALWINLIEALVDAKEWNKAKKGRITKRVTVVPKFTAAI